MQGLQNQTPGHSRQRPRDDRSEDQQSQDSPLDSTRPSQASIGSQGHRRLLKREEVNTVDQSDSGEGVDIKGQDMHAIDLVAVRRGKRRSPGSARSNGRSSGTHGPYWSPWNGEETPPPAQPKRHSTSSPDLSAFSEQDEDPESDSDSAANNTERTVDQSVQSRTTPPIFVGGSAERPMKNLPLPAKNLAESASRSSGKRPREGKHAVWSF